jgi:Tol biopolymer transport system component
MTPERLQQIQELYLAARDRGPATRSAFLDESCGGDEELRREVESLLAQGSGEVMDRPAMEVAGELLDSGRFGAGEQIGAYRIESQLGEGGMGTVYRATDTRLGREVALKFLSPRLAHDADYMARFEREAKVLASLNHPNIAIVHGLEESNGTRALVMELVEGPTLAARIAEGPIPPKEALRFAEAIAEGLEAANEKGVVHRDLKPGNVKITPEGGVKILDFGLAKTSGRPSGPAQDPSALTKGETEPGTILGTTGYMSPEQASGKPVDKRSDIWAFGVVLWEMLTGRRLFAGETVSHTLAEVLAAPIDFDKLPKETPPAIRNLVRRCLERDAKNRLRDIGEARIALQACLSGSAMTVVAEKELAVPKRAGLIWILGAVVVLLAGIASWALWPKTPAPVHAIRFAVPLPEGATFCEYVSLSPDGRKLLIAGPAVGLWIRDLNALEWQRLPNTLGAGRPFWSPDSRFIAFPVADQIKKIDISGGPAQSLSKIVAAGGGAWNRDGAIIVDAPNGPLNRISEAGGGATEITAVEISHGEIGHDLPSLLPDGKHFLYLIRGSPEVEGIYAGSLDAKPGKQPRKQILASRLPVSYANGYLFFMRDNTLMAQTFDPRALELQGEPVSVAENVDTIRDIGVFSVSPSGVLAYCSVNRSRGSQLTWFDRQGRVAAGVLGGRSSDTGLVLSPDGTRAAVRDTNAYISGDLWILDIRRGIRNRLTFRQGIIRPVVWSADGTHVIFAAGSHYSNVIYEKASTGAGDEKELFRDEKQNMVPTSSSRDGRFLLYHTNGTTPTDDLWVLPLEGDRKSVQLLATKFNERSASFSPDGRWIAYKSDETGRWEIYVRPFVASGSSGAPSLGEGKWQISKDGAAHVPTDPAAGFPHWRADGKEILFGSPNGAVMAVDVNTSGGMFQPPGVPKQLFTMLPNAGPWAVTLDGNKFLAPVAQAADESPTPITVVLNWRAELNR